MTFYSGNINDDLVVKSKLWAKSILYHVVYRKRLFLLTQPIYMMFEGKQVPVSVTVGRIVLTRMPWKDSLTQYWPKDSAPSYTAARWYKLLKPNILTCTVPLSVSSAVCYWWFGLIGREFRCITRMCNRST